MSRKNKEKRQSKRSKMSVSTGASFVPPPPPEASDEEEQALNSRRVPKGYMTAEVAAARLGLSPANFVAIHRSRVMRYEFAGDGMNYIKESDIEEIERMRAVRQQVMTAALVSKAVQGQQAQGEA